MAERSVALRIAVRDADAARQRLLSLGEEGEAALKKIETSSGRLGNTTKATTGETNKFSDAIRNASGPLSTLDGSLGGISSKFGGLGTLLYGSVNPAVAAFTVALAGTVGLLSASTAAASTAERSLFRMDAVLRTTGQASGRTTAQIQALADEIGQTTLATADSVEVAAAQLLTFRSISGETFDRTLRLAQDLAEVGFGSIESATVSLAKALEDPADGLNRLRRVGVSFTETQKELIKNLQETGDVAGAQTEILNVLEQQVGGAGVNAAGGLAGATNTLSERWDKLLEDIGNTRPWTAAIQAASELFKIIDEAIVEPPDLELLRGRVRELNEEIEKVRESGEAIVPLAPRPVVGPFSSIRPTGPTPAQVEEHVAALEKQREEIERVISSYQGLGRAQEVQAQIAAESAARVRAEAEADSKAAKEKEALTKANEKAAKEAANLAERLAEKRAEALEDLELEVRQNRALAAANEASADSYAAVARENEIENELRKLGLKLGTPEAAQTEELIRLKLEFADAVERTTKARKDEAAEVAKAAKDADRERERERDRTERELEREAERQAELLMEPLNNFLRSMQSQTADVFENIIQGGVTSFEDLFDQVLALAQRFVAEMAALLVFRPQLILGSSSAGTSLASQLGFAAGGTGGVANPAAGGTTTGPGGLLVGGGITSSSGAVAPTTSFLTPAVLGAGLAGIGAGTVGSGFLGGNPTGAFVGSAVGAIAGGAIGTAIPIIGTAIGAFAGGALGGLVGGLFGGGGGNNTGALRFSSVRGGPFGGPFGGFEISGENTFQGPLTELINDFDNAVSNFLTQRQVGLVRRAVQALDQFEGRFPESDPSAGFEKVLRERASTVLTSAFPDLRVGRVLEGASGVEDIARRVSKVLEVVDIFQELTNDISPVERAIEDIRKQFSAIRPIARELGLDIGLLNKAMKDQIQTVRDEVILSFEELTNQASPAERAIEDIRKQFAAIRPDARALGLDIHLLNEAMRDQIRVTRKAAEEASRQEKKRLLSQIDALALGVQGQFTALTDPLKAFQTQIEFGRLSPAGQLKAAREDFERLATLAESGNLSAISQLVGAGELLRQQAERFGASPLRAEVEAQILDTLDTVLSRTQSAQERASRGLENAIAQASNRQIDTLKELIAETRETRKEIRRLRDERARVA